MAGFIGIDRGIEDHWIYQDAEYFKVWFEILLRARFSREPEKKLMDGKFVTIEYGQFVYGRTSWSDRLKVSEQRMRTLFKKLIDDGMIELIQKFPKFSLYSVKNYAKYNQQSNQQQTQSYQGFTVHSNQQINDTATSSQPAANQQLTTQEESNNVFTTTTTTTSEPATVTDAHQRVFGTLSMNGLMQGYVMQLKNKGFTDRFIIELMLETGESATKPSLRLMQAIGERWEREKIYTRVEAKSRKTQSAQPVQLPVKPQRVVEEPVYEPKVVI